MKTVFIGNKNIGYLCLKQLIEWKKNIVAVIATEDDPHEGQWYKSVSKLAEENGIKLFKPPNINDPKFVKEVKALDPDLFFTAQFPQIYKKEFISIPKKGCINLHFAPLPRYRGCFPIAWAIIEDSKDFGVTIHHIEEGIDNGRIIAQKLFAITNNDTGKILYSNATKYAFELFKETFPLFDKNIPKGERQDDAKASHHKRDLPFGGRVDWSWNSRRIFNFIRALNFVPFECAFTTVNGKKIHFAESKISEKSTKGKTNGEIIGLIDNEGFKIKTLDGSIIITKIQLEKDNFVSAYEYFKKEGFKLRDIFK